MHDVCIMCGCVCVYMCDVCVCVCVCVCVHEVCVEGRGISLLDIMYHSLTLRSIPVVVEVVLDTIIDVRDLAEIKLTI